MYIYRQYNRHVRKFIENLKANPSIRADRFKDVGSHLVIKDPSSAIEREEAKELVRLGAEANIVVLPGMRLMPVKPALGWLDAQYWAMKAEELNALCRLFADDIDTRYLPFDPQNIDGLRFMPLDIEDYVSGTARAQSEPQLAAAMKPFLDALRANRIYPGIYPAVLDFPNAVIADAVGGKLEFWTEVSFGHPLAVLNNNKVEASTLALARARESFAVRWPQAVVRHGAYDDYLRDWGAPARARRADYGRLDPWFFDHARLDNDFCGTPDWLSGKSLSSLNDAKHIWRGNPSTDRFVTVQGGLPMTLVSVQPAAGRRGDLMSSKGALFMPGRAAYASRILPLGDFTVMIEFLVTQGQLDGPLFGSAQANSETWQVNYRAPNAVENQQNGIVLHIRLPNAIVSSVVTVNASAVALMENVPFDVPLRLVLSRVGREFRATLCVADSVRRGTYMLPANATLSGGGHLWVNSGNKTPYSASRTQVTSEGLVFTEVEMWDRALSDAEQQFVGTKKFPRGGAF